VNDSSAVNVGETLGVAVDATTPVGLGVGAGVGVSVGVELAGGTGVWLGDGEDDADGVALARTSAVGDGSTVGVALAVSVGVGGAPSKRSSATRSAAVVRPSPLASTSGQAPAEPKTLPTIAGRSKTSTTASQFASAGSAALTRTAAHRTTPAVMARARTARVVVAFTVALESVWRHGR
jgi:hypothetical protein